MASLDPKQIDDLVLLTQNALIKRGAFVDLQSDLTDYVGVRELYKPHKKTFAGGLDWEFEAQVDHNHSARFVGLYENDGASIRDTFIMGKVSPRFVDAHYIYDTREPILQRGGIQVVDFVKSKYTSMIISYWELMESAIWGKPENSGDRKTPYGVPYWITKGASEGFTGLDPVGFTDGRAGISSVDYPRWANYSSPYTAVSKEDLIRKMRRAHRRTKFRSPVSHATPNLGSMRNGIYTNDNVIGIFEEVLEASNMNLGNDLASKDGKTMFKGTPVIYAPYLDNDSSDPVYMLDWKWLALGMLEGWMDKASAPAVVPGKHNVRSVFLDSGFNMVCTDLRRHAVFYKE